MDRKMSYWTHRRTVRKRVLRHISEIVEAGNSACPMNLETEAAFEVNATNLSLGITCCYTGLQSLKPKFWHR